MNLAWCKWSLEFFRSLGRHIGTAGLTWLGFGVRDGAVDWGNLWICLLTGAILPTVFTFLQKHPVPDEEEDEKETKI